MKKTKLIILVMLFLNFSFVSAASENVSPMNFNITTQNTTQKIYDLDVGYYDVWKHMDGTWQQGIKPGSSVTHSHTVEYQGEGTVKSVKMSFYENSKSDYDKTIRASWQRYSDYMSLMYPYAVNNHNSLNYSLNKNTSSASFTIKTKLTDNYGLGGLDIKKDWQGGKVEGKRFYIPILIEWEVEMPTQATVEFFLVNKNTQKVMYSYKEDVIIPSYKKFDFPMPVGYRMHRVVVSKDYLPYSNYKYEDFNLNDSNKFEVYENITKLEIDFKEDGFKIYPK